MRGAFVVVEGCDRSGKSTQCKKLVDTLNNMDIPAELISFPDRTTPIGKIIDAYLRKEVESTDQAIHLLFCANRWELEHKIKSQLLKGITLIVDRYSYSGVAYTAAKKVMELDWCKSPEVGLPKPDLVIYLTVSEEAIADRKGFGEERYENPSFQKLVADIFLSLKDDNWKIVDADKTVSDLHDELLKIVQETVKTAKTKPVGSLW